MVGVVIVSHSAKLAEGVRELAEQMAQGNVPIAVAGGIDDPENPIGTDAFKVLAAIEAVFSDDGVLVLMDLGSALLSAETAVEFLGQERQDKVRLCTAPLVEGAVAAVSRARIGGDLAAVAREANDAWRSKAGNLPWMGRLPETSAGRHELLLTLHNELGLHARPAAQLIRLAGGYRAQLTLRNITRELGPADATSLNGLLGLGARQGHQIAITAQGNEAREALAAVAELIEAGFGETAESAATDFSSFPPRPAEPSTGALRGTPASPGIAIGPLAVMRPTRIEVAKRRVDDPEAEWRRLQVAIEEARAEVRDLVGKIRLLAGEKDASIFEAHLLFLQDPVLLNPARQLLVEQKMNAEAAWQTAIDKVVATYDHLDDAYLQARAADLIDVGQRVIRLLSGGSLTPAAPSKPSILVARELSPSDVGALELKSVLGLCTEEGSANGHSAILARSLGIPMVVGLGTELSQIAEKTLLAIDGKTGEVWVEPHASALAKLQAQRFSWLAARRASQVNAHRPSTTRDGRRIKVLANIAGLAGARAAMAQGADGVGLLRSEFLFMGRGTPLGEEEQIAAYGAIADALGPRPLTIRTLDIGGDKRLPYITMGHEANPFLGWRGLRVSLEQRDLLTVQLRAILRAGLDRHLEIMFPMVSTVSELCTAKTILADVKAELRRSGLAFHEDIAVGIMIEVPAAAVMADRLVGKVDFVSLGTNDLSQYIMAADRTNARVAALADPLQSAVLHTVYDVIRTAQTAGTRVALCGELAGDPIATPLLLGMGLTEFSVGVSAIPVIKAALHRLTLGEAKAAVEEALALDSVEDVRRSVSARFPFLPSLLE